MTADYALKVYKNYCYEGGESTRQSLVRALGGDERGDGRQGFDQRA